MRIPRSHQPVRLGGGIDVDVGIQRAAAVRGGGGSWLMATVITRAGASPAPGACAGITAFQSVHTQKV